MQNSAPSAVLSQPVLKSPETPTKEPAPTTSSPVPARQDEQAELALEEAKSVALYSQVRKKDSKLNKYLLDTWSSHSQFEHQINQLKAYIET
jgi:hypothetical protein